MKRAKYVLLLLIVFILFVVGIFITNNRNSIKQNDQVKNTTDSVKVNNVTKDTIPSQNSHVHDSVLVGNGVKNMIPSNWKAYDKNALGVTFKYPDTWAKNGEENNVVNRLGNIVAIEVNFIDTLTSTTLLVSYHLPPEGKELYRYAVSQFESSQGWYKKGGKLIKIAGNIAVEAFTEMSLSGKGTELDPPLRLILIDFLDKQQTGAIQLQFKTPLPNDNIEVAKFERFLSTIEFTN